MGEKKNYFGITVGPITRVLSYAHSTRAVWASSYFFSDLSRRLVEPLYNSGHKFLKPIVTEELFGERTTVGRFPDQYIFEAKPEDTFESLMKLRADVLDDVARRMSVALEKNKDILKQYLSKTIKIYLLDLSSENPETVVEEMQNRMSCAEFRDTFADSQKRDYLSVLFESNIGVLRSFFELDKEDLGGFDSLPEAAYHKYVAFVAADGDNFGKCMAKLGGNAFLFNVFGAELAELVNDYGGQVIYQGGDDVSFYAPVYNEVKGLDIFGLIKQIDEALKNTISNNGDVKRLGINVSMSYGVAISYEKHPMAETRQLAEELMYDAKAIEGKNAIVWKLRKHSGQLAGGKISKNNKELFNNTCGLQNYASRVEEEFLHSITYWLKRYEEPLHYILKKSMGPNANAAANRPVRKAMLENFIDKNFNEDVHDRSKELLTSLIPILLDPSFEGKPEEAISYLHNALRYVGLLIRKPENR